MVVHLEQHHLFKHSFERVVAAYFQKYSNGHDPNVKKVTIEEHVIDHATGIEFFRRQGICQNVLPWLFKQIMNEPEIKFEEEIWLNRKERWMKLQSRNLSWPHIAQLKETSIFKRSQVNGNWTSFEQSGTVDCQGLGRLASIAERLAKSFLMGGSHKGVAIMENLLQPPSQRIPC